MGGQNRGAYLLTLKEGVPPPPPGLATCFVKSLPKPIMIRNELNPLNLMCVRLESKKLEWRTGPCLNTKTIFHPYSPFIFQLQVEERLSRFVAMATESVAPATESQPRLLGVQKKRSRKRLVAGRNNVENCVVRVIIPASLQSGLEYVFTSFSHHHNDSCFSCPNHLWLILCILDKWSIALGKGQI